VIGSLSSGFMSDSSILGHRKDLTCLLFSLLLLPTFGVLVAMLSLHTATEDSLSPLSPNMYLLAGCMLLVGVGGSGPKTLIGLMVRNCVPGQHMGLAGGVLGFVGQLGGAAAGSGLGALVQTQGWGVFFPTLLGVAVLCSGLLGVFMWYESESDDKGGRGSLVNKRKKEN
jgi:sugar phosphate permease